MKEAQSKLSNLNEYSSDNGIKIPDITSNAFDFLIKYVYGLNPTISNENVVDVLYLGKKYLIKPIEVACINKLKQKFKTISSIDDIFTTTNKLYGLGMNVCKLSMLYEFV